MDTPAVRGASGVEESPVSPATSSRGDEEQAEGIPFPVVGVGASAGGLEAFSQLLGQLPVDTGMAFVLVQHLDPHHDSQLADLLSRSTRLPVREAADGMAVLPDHVYVIPRNTTLTLAQGLLRLTARADTPGLHLPIDTLFRSLAEEPSSKAIGVVLSGTGADGTLGLAEIKSAGGITFAQDPASAPHPGMPQSAIASGCVDFTLAPAAIAQELARIGAHPYLAPTNGAGAPPLSGEEDHFRRVLARVRTVFGVDFTHYRETTIRRRIMRRMALHRIETLAEYAWRLEGDRAEVDALYHDMLINVTRFFRDPEAFETLKSRVFPPIIDAKSPGTPIRVWAPGCSTGQEAYSLAICLLEYLEEKPIQPPIQIFATDLSDQVALAHARAGLYPESIEAEISPERLRRFFTKEEGGYRICKFIRDLCVFARQNVAGDPPFSRVDLISCRNLLIYLSPPLQRRVLQTFHYALTPTGFLALGTSETVGEFTDLFGVIDKKHKIYSRKATTIRQYPHFSAEEHPAGMPSGIRAEGCHLPASADWQREADRVLLGQYAPPGVLVTEQLEILQFRGRTGPYLEPAPGEASLNLLKMARDGLFLAVRSAVDEARRENAAVRRSGVRMREEGRVRLIDLHVLPVRLPNSDGNCFLVLFEEPGQAAVPTAPPAALSTTAPLTDEPEDFQLRQELADARAYLQAIIEQQEAANEELKAANEEILSGNEELQSTNEELETAKEELQSVNEELTTVNEQMQYRNVELSQVNNDLTNLLASTTLPIVMLESDLRIRRFTATAGELLNLLPGDVGRSIVSIRPTLDVPDLEPLLLEVIATVQPREREVQDHTGRWYTLHIHPYRTADNKTDGAVVVLLDIHEARSAQETIRAARDYAQAVVETVQESLLILDAELRVKTANQSFYESFQVLPQATEGRFIYDLGNGQWNLPVLRRRLAEILTEHTHLDDSEVEHTFPTIGHRTMLLNARRIVAEEDQAPLILLAIEDITERRRAEKQLQGHLDEMARSNRAAVGRELRMIELKKEVNDLLQHRGDAARYPLDFEQEGSDA